MGYVQAAGVIGAVDVRTALAWHLQYNLYPPVPAIMLPVLEDAIDAVIAEDFDQEIDLPDPVTYKGRRSAPAWEIVRQHHLEAFIDSSINEEDY